MIDFNILADGILDLGIWVALGFLLFTMILILKRFLEGKLIK